MASWFMIARAASHSTVCGKSTTLALAIPATPHAWWRARDMSGYFAATLARICRASEAMRMLSPCAWR